MGTCDVAVAEHVSDVEVTECFIVQYLVFAFSCLSFVQRKEQSFHSSMLYCTLLRGANPRHINFVYPISKVL